MSGLEIAGVVLGALPLVISALEHYAKGVETAKRFYRFQSGLNSMINLIETEKTMFLNTFELFLTGIVGVGDMADFVNRLSENLEQAPQTEQKLMKRLGGAYGVYLKNVEGMKSALSVMMQKLGLDAHGKPRSTNPSLFKSEYNRWKFSIGKAEYDEQISQLQNYNAALSRLTQQSLALEPFRTQRGARSCPKFNLIRQHARSLFDTLRSGLCCPCDSHAVKLQLEDRHITSAEEDEPMVDTPFRVIFTFVAQSGSTSAKSEMKVAPWDWAEAEVRCSAEMPKRPAVHKATHSAPTPKTKRRVQFSSTVGQASNQGAAGPSGGSQSTPPSETASVQIQDLCKALATLSPSQQDLCMGYLVDSLKRKYNIYLSKTSDSCPQQQWAAFSLREVLTRTVDGGQSLTQQDKLRIAVNLASSALQLYKTPWLDEAWSDNDIYFVQRTSVFTKEVYKHPFVYRKLASTSSASLRHSRDPQEWFVIKRSSRSAFCSSSFCMGRRLNNCSSRKILIVGEHQASSGVLWTE
ncbi:hypothetical protein NX059_001323 [Plenodomus lindquistii]|nr:hypothetical protein NX059_001323 [Plenodomus lindquistii]